MYLKDITPLVYHHLMLSLIDLALTATFFLYLLDLNPYNLPLKEWIVATKSSTISLSGLLSPNSFKYEIFAPNSDK